MKRFSNKDIADILYETAALYEMEGVSFKPRAYERAALEIESLAERVSDLYHAGGREAIKEIGGIGRGIAAHIEELLTKGDFDEHKRLKKKIPVRVTELLAVEGVGPKSVAVLWKKLKIRNTKDLERAAKNARIRALPGFGVKSEEGILKGVEFLKQSHGRFVLGFILPDIKRLEAEIKKFPETREVVAAGSVRRMRETVGDIDILVVSDKPVRVMERVVKLPDVVHVYGTGKTKTNVRLARGIDVDVRVVPQESLGAALNYFTGSKAHNIALREIAACKGWRLSEYGLFRGTRAIAGSSEEGLYRKLGLRYVEPELREDRGEIEAACRGKLPQLIGYDDLLGDLQVQTRWTDGASSIRDMAREAERRGLSYIAVTDHTRMLAMTGGLHEKGLSAQAEEICEVNEEFRRRKSAFRVLAGAEVNILKDGSLDISDKALAKLDVVGAAVHSHFNLSGREETRRIIRAMENPHVDIIFHLTARLINRRRPIRLDMDRVIRHAKKTKTVLEIDAYPDRADIPDDIIKRCVEAGVRMSIDSDAHAARHFDYLRFGIAQARRGWAEKKDIINAWPVEKMLGMLK